MKRIVIGMLALALALLPLAGCGSEVIEGAEGLETEEVLSESTLPAAQPETIVEPEAAEEPESVVDPESVVEPEGTPDKEEEKEEERLVYEPPEETPEVMPLFASAELDLSSSTPEEIVIRILYYDEAGEQIHWEAVGRAELGGRVQVEIWKGTPTEEERQESRQHDKEYYESFVVLGIIDQTGFYISSSKTVIVIPISTLNAYDGEVVTVRTYIMPVQWGVDFAGQNPNLPNALNYLEAPLQKNW